MPGFPPVVSALEIFRVTATIYNRLSSSVHPSLTVPESRPSSPSSTSNFGFCLFAFLTRFLKTTTVLGLPHSIIVIRAYNLRNGPHPQPLIISSL